ncbi:RluA family pseudouridine synthase [Erythrobacteraceae bacterium CFH 75059]|uniref:RluA family pseudouridine synthase n=1 Tax=Qipengyuania thermophila TaxID=2509361 RepID=UPI00101F86A3|nr:RluA family pseudouridine synthase [Qipengyuania thermophila]TCD02033.1 RluA family pseudouridine synthase [Erythrobacteraceae bacterium CFH 75059]
MDAERIITGTLAAPDRLDRALAAATGLSRERVKRLLASGAVSLDGAPARDPSARAAAGAAYAVRLAAPQPLATPAQDIPLDIVFEDKDLLVVNKPAGLVVHPAAGNPDGTLVNALLHHCRGTLSGINGTARPGIVHRIDKDTSGLLVVAKTDRAHENLGDQFSRHAVHRRYVAVCNGHPQPSSGTVTARIGRSPHDRKRMAVLPADSARGKHAVTHYRLLQVLKDCSVIECRLETGRTHQVRVHLASIGHPLVGDPVYGRAVPALRPVLTRLGFARQALHAAELGFAHPQNGRQLRFSAPLPQDMVELIEENAR